MNADGRRSTLVLLGLVALALALYANALTNPFLIDDLDAIVSHPDVVEPGGTVTLWTHDYWAGRSPEDRNLYRPIVVLSYWLNARLTGVSSPAFRIINVLLLATLAWLVYMWRPQGWIAPVAAMLIVAHPAHATVINNVIGRADLLAMIGVMGFALAQQRSLQHGRWTPLTTAAAVVACVFALGSKETGLLIVPVALMQCLLHDRTPRRSDALIIGVPLATYLIARAAVVGVTPHYGPATMDLTGNPLRGMGVVERLPGAVSLAWVYWRETVWPTLKSSHIPEDVPTWSSAATWAGALVLIAVACATTQALKRRSWLLVACVLVIGNIMLIGNILTPIGVYAGYRLMPPFIIAAAMALAAIPLRSPRTKHACVVALVIVVAISSLRTLIHNNDWKDHLTLMRANLERQPGNSRAAFLYGVALGEQNRQREGIDYVERAVKRHPDSSQARHEYGKMLIVLGRFDEAIANYHALLQTHGDDVAAMNQLAGLAMLAGDATTAARLLNQAEKRAPDDPGVMHNLAVLAVMTGRTNDAMMRYEALLRRYPDHANGRAEYEELKRQSRESSP